ncbi:glycosyltransferase [Acetobacter sp. AN02]|uniref:glycosyltransferase n=1 Tax=Acetobacter sp. AN02 TaxID=2894186 RepID=UPI0024341216|nr:glycosyltransferase [Acetobacter sp. AN02]MDG6094357.1 glycosyltransferase [Acetobacter sp. AN02]
MSSESSDLPDPARLRTRLARTEALADSYRASARIHSFRSDAFAADAHAARQSLTGWTGSKAGRLVAILRILWRGLHGEMPGGRSFGSVSARAAEILREEGAGGLAERIRGRLPSRRRSGTTGPGGSGGADPEAVFTAPVSSGRLREMTPKLLIIAELSLQQCAKYRVWQRQEQLESLGWDVAVTDWRDQETALSGLQVCTEVIFYRVPGFPTVLRLTEEARRLGLSPWWEVDDLIFDESQYNENGNLSSLGARERNDLLKGVRLFRIAMLSCSRAIASTPALAECMRQAGVAETRVIRNALDADTLHIADEARLAAGGVRGDDLTIVYGSGSRTHDRDFVEAAGGILAAMKREPRLRLRIIGDLTLPPEFGLMEGRVERLAARDYRSYMRLLAGADISIAPLEPTLFNDAKSNIKFLESAVLGVPCICSPRAEFREAVRDGETGLLAEGDAQWAEAILRLAGDADLRRSLGDAARRDVLVEYSPEAIRAAQVEPVFPRCRDGHDPVPGAALRVMTANVYFAPRSFGGATLIAEEMSWRLVAGGAELSVFTSRPPGLADRYNASLRYETHGLPVLGCVVPPDHDRVAALDVPRNTAQFADWVRAMRPDIVHIHALQGLGLGLVRCCAAEGIPVAITLHDAWFLCDRQFMVRADGRYCFQRKISLRTCQSCVPEARHLSEREIMMRQALDAATILLTPSESHRQLYIANGIASEKILVNRNGFYWPEAPRPARPAGAPLRFGYVGGTEDVKGYSILREAFESLDRSDWSLTLVDNKLNLGFASIFISGWKVRGQVQVAPAYDRAGMDAFFAGIDVLVFPSQWMESYGLTVREALARDVWVIATAPGGQAEDIEDGVNGTLIPLDDTLRGLRRAVTGLLDAPGRFGAYENPHKDRLPDFDGQAKELLEILEQTVARFRAEATAPV